jgi:excisionase family DNA binding protein
MERSEQYPPVLDTEMVAELLGMNVQVVRRLAREGQIPSYRLPEGRTYRFFRDEVLEWLRGFPVHAGTADDAELPVPVDDGA